MATLSWNEIQSRAGEFAAKWRGETYEKGESQSLWTDFLTVYGIDRRRQGALFTLWRRTANGERCFVDLHSPGKLGAEQRSASRNLENTPLILLLA